MLWRLLLITLLLAYLSAFAPAQEPDDARIEIWIEELGSDSFAARQTASKNLALRGARAIPSLVAICESSADRETVTRAIAVLGQILESRDPATSLLAEKGLVGLAESPDKPVAHHAKETLRDWRMSVSQRAANRLRRLGASIGQPTTAADGTPEVYLQILQKEWKGADADLEALPDLGRIGLFRVDQARIGNEGFKFLEKCRSVDQIYLDQTPIDARGLAIVAKAPSLRRLTIKGLQSLDRDGMESIGAIATLEYLSLDGCNVTSEMLAVLSDLKSLGRLDLSRTKVSDSGLAALADLPKLQILVVAGATIDGEGIARLAKAPKLDTLNLHGAHLGPKALDAIGSLTQVRHLILDGIDLSSADFSKLANMKGLRQLDLSDCQITDNNARSLGTLTGVTTLLLRKNPVSSDLRDQIAAQIPKCQILP